MMRASVTLVVSAVVGACMSAAAAAKSWITCTDGLRTATREAMA